jgi:hypothetical protein
MEAALSSEIRKPSMAEACCETKDTIFSLFFPRYHAGAAIYKF